MKPKQLFAAALAFAWIGMAHAAIVNVTYTGTAAPGSILTNPTGGTALLGQSGAAVFVSAGDVVMTDMVFQKSLLLTTSAPVESVMVSTFGSAYTINYQFQTENAGLAFYSQGVRVDTGCVLSTNPYPATLGVVASCGSAAAPFASLTFDEIRYSLTVTAVVDPTSGLPAAMPIRLIQTAALGYTGVLTPVPEPGGLVLAVAGLAGVLVVVWKSRAGQKPMVGRAVC